MWYVLLFCDVVSGGCLYLFSQHACLCLSSDLFCGLGILLVLDLLSVLMLVLPCQPAYAVYVVRTPWADRLPALRIPRTTCQNARRYHRPSVRGALSTLLLAVDPQPATTGNLVSRDPPNNNASYLHGMSPQVGLDGTPEVLLDPNTLSKDGTSALSGVDFSKDGKMLAYGISEKGSDW